MPQSTERRVHRPPRSAELARWQTLATRNYLSSAIAKLGVSNRYEAALEARKRGWI